ncbi:hypothetical protein [Blastococcus saxobsidens]|uniref:Uncharacterized protein n=1 Tax=Blastococcus saxobsidens (strain DD2) TaxID=1146883 RepID=H6RU99_BLASD|nr:hypothetical protein [Blastococcus saxobsidens]CCG05706.1 conserved protein of unknown function [Blastococcus saxobsidens DD2]
MIWNSDELGLLRVLAMTDEPVGMFDVTTAINPEPRDQKEREAWLARQLELIDTFLGLYRRGLVHEVVPANGHTGDRYALTQEGQEVTGRRLGR